MFDPQAFWRDPEASTDVSSIIVNICKPEFYLTLENVTRLVVSTIGKHCHYSDSILEIGSGTGRNLVGINNAGYHNVSGIEISRKAIKAGERYYGFGKLPIINEAVEDCIKDIAPVDVIFTQGCLMHLPPESEWVLDVISDKANKLIITIENETGTSSRAWPRNYDSIFTSLGWTCIEHFSCEEYPPLPADTILRVFTRKDVE